jgi:hypothetical protein
MKIIYLSLLLLCFNAKCQETLVKILDKSNSEPVPFAVYEYKNTINYANDKGEITLQNTDCKDTLQVSCIGYRKNRIVICGNTKVLYLEPLPIELEAVIIRNDAKNVPVKLGNCKTTNNSVRTSKGITVGSFMENITDKQIYINRIVFTVTSKMTDESFIRLHLFNCENGIPKDEIIIPNMISSVRGKKITFDFQTEQLFFKKSGLFICLEWLTDGIEDNYVALSKSKNKNNVWVKKSLINGSTWNLIENFEYSLSFCVAGSYLK